MPTQPQIMVFTYDYLESRNPKMITAVILVRPNSGFYFFSNIKFRDFITRQAKKMIEEFISQ